MRRQLDVDGVVLTFRVESLVAAMVVVLGGVTGVGLWGEGISFMVACGVCWMESG